MMNNDWWLLICENIYGRNRPRIAMTAGPCKVRDE